MIIQDDVGETQVTIGSPSTNHVTLSQWPNNEERKQAVTFHYAEWKLLKEKIDKMFEIKL